ncbi:unnamed protein product, partial [Onchocerca flexuosa]|uniref:Ovule protein n=1 Tax=Onchocerca flexuosa TaxID=387005 RepID=A0A183HUY0_9BILA
TNFDLIHQNFIKISKIFSIQLLSSLLNSESRYYSTGHCNPSLSLSSDNSNYCDTVTFPNLPRLELFLGSHSSSQLPSPVEEDCQKISQISNDNTPTYLHKI